MGTIEELLERVKVAPGPDLELDAMLHAMADGRTVRENLHPQFGRQLLARNSRPPHDEYWLDHPANVNPPYTASIDAALALTERVLPGWKRSLFEKRGGAGWVARVSSPRYETSSSGEDTPMPSASLALLAATLSALLAQAKP